MLKIIEIDEELFLKYRTGSSDLMFKTGEITEEMIKHTPEGTQLIPLTYTSEVTVGGVPLTDLEFTSWWVVIYLDGGGIVRALVGHSITPDWIMERNSVDWDTVISIDRVAKSAFNAYAPFFIIA